MAEVFQGIRSERSRREVEGLFGQVTLLEAPGLAPSVRAASGKDPDLRLNTSDSLGEVLLNITRWQPRGSVTPQETALLKRAKRSRNLFAFLRLHRTDIFSAAFQGELETMCRKSGAGRAPIPPALMAMALILQGYLGVSDAEAVELTVVDLRWQMVLDTMGSDEPAFSQGALFDFRERLIRTDMDRRLFEHTAEVARTTGAFDWKKLPKTLPRSTPAP